MGKQEQRSGILEVLRFHKQRQYGEEYAAKAHIEYVNTSEHWASKPEAEKQEFLKKDTITAKCGCYTPTYFLRQGISEVMGIKPTKRTRLYNAPHEFSDKDNEILETIITRLDAQGFIKLSKSGKAFRVLKCED